MATSPDQVEVRVCPEPVRHRMELRERGHLHNIRVGPYNSHNLLVTHANFLRSTNDDPGPGVYRLFPFGGTFSLAGDIVGLLTWYLLLVYTVVTIPLACYCDVAQLNITNAVILAILCMYHICAIYFVFRNKAKLKKMWFIAKTTAKKLQRLAKQFFKRYPEGHKGTSASWNKPKTRSRTKDVCKEGQICDVNVMCCLLLENECNRPGNMPLCVSGTKSYKYNSADRNYQVPHYLLTEPPDG